MFLGGKGGKGDEGVGGRRRGEGGFFHISLFMFWCEGGDLSYNKRRKRFFSLKQNGRFFEKKKRDSTVKVS